MKERVLQFGEGNFLRAFVDYFIDQLNEQKLFDGSIVIVQPIEHGLVDKLMAQNCQYTALLRDANTVEKRLITSVSRGLNPYTNFDDYLECAKNPDLRYVFSNTTEAGITFIEEDKPEDRPPSSFPAKVTVFLYERYKHCKKGLVFVPCELIDDNGTMLKKYILQYAQKWGLPTDFIAWIENENHFVNTLVDRIVSGHPKDEKHDDKMLVAAETFQFFAIEATEDLFEEMPLHKVGATLTDDVGPYKTRKVRILNGAHTMSNAAALLCGKETVGEMMADPLFVAFLRKGIFNEIIPTLDLDLQDLESFAESVLERFANPYIKHFLKDIALNSESKFEVRVLPSIIEYHKRTGQLPNLLTLSYAALVKFCGANLDISLPDFNQKVEGYLKEIDEIGMEALLKKVVAKCS